MVLRRLQQDGLLDAAIGPEETETDPDLLAARIVGTFLRGLG